jgi:murein DD-endopeptidase MepM/ murein hydrolase activator NlpD
MTVYAHLSRFEKGLRSGNRVSKGQVIGYVGSTGLSTGPHLHYEIRLDGVHKDPQKYSPPKQKSVPQDSMAKFVRTAKEVLTKLNI